MRPRVSSILGFPEEKLKREVEKEDEEEDSLGSSSEGIAAVLEVELHIPSLLTSTHNTRISSFLQNPFIYLSLQNIQPFNSQLIFNQYFIT